MCVCLLFWVGCATQTSAELERDAFDKDKLVDDAPSDTPTHSTFSRPKTATASHPKVQPVDAPRTEAGARRALQKGLHALQKEEFNVAAAYFDAVLTTDLLTERGRLNLYWMAADSHQKVSSYKGEGAALESFLLLALVVDEKEPRVHQAMARLQALKMRANPQLGRTQEHAIWVRDLREPASIMAAFSCSGSDRDALLVDENIQSFTVGNTRLLKRSARCAKGPLVELWFDVTGAAPSTN